MHLFNKYLTNTCLPLEKDALYGMLSHPFYKDTLNQKMQESWKLPSAELGYKLLSINDLHRKTKERKPTQLNVSKSFKTITKGYWAAAAFIFFACLTSLFFLSKETEPINQKDLTSLSAGIGEREYMILPDSNKIWLNSGSTIRFPEDFSFNEVVAGSIASWKESNLEFENIQFGEVAVTLQKPFEVEFLFDIDTHRKCRFTANLDLKEDLDKVLKASTKFNAFSSSEENSNIYFI
tara:strand:- start:10436 stop:11143 length:708 start_codon:yes stop_codon:yes gene_type:complete